jgi:hypothetical protein
MVPRCCCLGVRLGCGATWRNPVERDIMIMTSNNLAHHSSRGRFFFASPGCRKGQVQLQLIAPRFPRRGGRGEDPGEEHAINFAHRIIRKESPKSREKRSPWSFHRTELRFLHMCSQLFIRPYHSSGVPSLSSSSSLSYVIYKLPGTHLCAQWV